MTVELNKGTYILGMWYAELRYKKGNLMTCVTKVDGKWKLQYRFRYYKDNLVELESQDEKKWWGGERDGEISELEIFEGIEGVHDDMRTQGLIDRHEFFPVYGDAQWFGELLANGGGPKWMHAHVATPEEIERYRLSKKESP